MTHEQNAPPSEGPSAADEASRLTESQLVEAQRIIASGVIKDSRKSDAVLLGSVLVALAINTHALRLGAAPAVRTE